MEFSSIVFIVKFAAVAALLLVSACGLGSWILKMRSSSFGERVFFQSCLGMAIWSYSIFCLASLSLLYRISVLLLLVVSLFGAWKNVRIPKIGSSSLDNEDKLFLLSLFFGTAPSFFLSLYPPHSCDDTGYHLASANIFCQAHALVGADYLRFPVFNEFMEMLFSGTLCFRSDVAAQLICWITNLLILVGIYTALKRYVNSSAGLVGVAVWLSSPIALRLCCIAFVEVPVAQFCLASTILALRLIKEPTGKYLNALLAGVFAGCAMACKYTAIPFCIGVAFSIACISFFERKQRRLFISLAAIFTVNAILISFPWFMRNYIYTGNPTFPYFSEVFGQRAPWDSWDYQFLNGVYQRYQQIPITLAGFVQFLWRISFDQTFNEFGVGFTPFFLPGTVAAACMSMLHRERKSLFVLIMPVVFSVLPLFLHVQTTRFLVSALPVVALYTAWSGTLVFAWLAAQCQLLEFTRASLPALLLGLVIGTVQWSYGGSLLRDYGPIPVSGDQRRQFLSKALPTYPAYEILNTLPRGRLYAFGDEEMNYYYKKGVFMGAIFGLTSYSRILPYMGTGKNLYAYMQRCRANYLLINRKAHWGRDFPNDIFFQEHFRELFRNENCVLYDVVGIGNLK
jgi:hypothetical protein